MIFEVVTCECRVFHDRPVKQAASPITDKTTATVLGEFMSRFLTLTQMSKIPAMWDNHTNRMLVYFLCSLMLNVYVGVFLCGSSGRLHVFSPRYLWAIQSCVYTPKLLSCEKCSRVGWPWFFFSWYSQFFKPLMDYFKVPARACSPIFGVIWFWDFYSFSLHQNKTRVCLSAQAKLAVFPLLFASMMIPFADTRAVSLLMWLVARKQIIR